VLRFEVTADTFATVREAIARLRRTSETRLGDDAALLAMARAVLGGPSDHGRASYQLSLSVCPECDRGLQRAAGQPVRVSAEVVEMARCEAQHLGPVASSANDNWANDGAADNGVDNCADDGADDWTGDANPSRPRAPTCPAHDAPVIAHTPVSRAQPQSTNDPGDPSSNAPVIAPSGVDPAHDASVVAHTPVNRAQPQSANAPGDPSGNVPVIARSRVDPAHDASVVAPTPVGRAQAQSANDPGGGQTNVHVGSVARHRTTQSVPPGLRRRVLARDHHVCQVPGCNNSLFLDLHHITPRVEGGANAGSNLISLCGVHHRAIHTGELIAGAPRPAPSRSGTPTEHPTATPSIQVPSTSTPKSSPRSATSALRSETPVR
jgi:hypothetical protein